MSGVSGTDLQVIVAQGRYLAAAIAWMIDAMGANINDTYFSAGLATLILQAAFVVSILRSGNAWRDMEWAILALSRFGGSPGAAA